MSKIYTFNNKIVTINNKWAEEYVEPTPPGPTPIVLPDYTIRAKFTANYSPSYIGDSQTLVDSDNNIWDIVRTRTDWSGLFQRNNNLIEIIGVNPSNVYDMSDMFYQCESLISVPLIDTSNVTNVQTMFSGCTNVQRGALALYTQMSTQTNPPYKHSGTFYNCGSNTTTGAAELAQIPSDWK